MRYYSPLILLLVLIFAGCAAVPAPVVEFDKSARYMPIAIVVNDGVIESWRSSVGYASATFYDETSSVLREELSKTGVFRFVELNNPYQEVVLNIAFSRENIDENFAKSILQGGTVMLLPTTDKWKTTAEIVIRARAEIIKSYYYELESVERVFLADDAYAGRRQVAQALWSRFLAEAQKDKLFEELIPAALARQQATSQPSDS